MIRTALATCALAISATSCLPMFVPSAPAPQGHTGVTVRDGELTC
ncbi:hypothetical protein [Nonomuraea sp. NPDC048826]